MKTKFCLFVLYFLIFLSSLYIGGSTGFQIIGKLNTLNHEHSETSYRLAKQTAKIKKVNKFLPNIIKSNSRIKTPSKPPGKTHMASLVIQNIVIDHEIILCFHIYSK